MLLRVKCKGHSHGEYCELIGHLPMLYELLHIM